MNDGFDSPPQKKNSRQLTLIGVAHYHILVYLAPSLAWEFVWKTRVNSVHLFLDYGGQERL